MAAERPMKRLIRAKSDDKSKKIATCDSQDDLFSDEEDQRYLDSLGDDYTREKELTRRFEQKLRQRQREELLGRSSVKALTRSSSSSSSRSLRRLSGSEGQEQIDNSQSTSDYDRGPNFRDDAGGSATPPRGSRSYDANAQRRFTDYSPIADENSHSTPRGAWRSRHKRFEKHLNALRAASLDTIRVGPPMIKLMEEHPQVARYLQDCLVFVPSTSLEASGVPETTLSKDVLPYRVCQITALEPANDASSSKCLFDVSVIPLGGSKTSRIPVHMLLDKAFEDHDVQDIRMRIRESDDLKWTGFVESLAVHIKEKARQLRDFTFTEEDVAEILKRKQQRACANAISANSLDTASPFVYRSWSQRKEELAAQIEEIEAVKLQDDSLTAAERKHYSEVLRDLKTQMCRLQRVRMPSSAPSTFDAVSQTSQSFRSQRQNTSSDSFIQGGRPRTFNSSFPLLSSQAVADRCATQGAVSVADVWSTPHLPVSGRPTALSVTPESLLRLLSSTIKPGDHVTKQKSVALEPKCASSLWPKTLSITQETALLTAFINAFRDRMQSFAETSTNSPAPNSLVIGSSATVSSPTQTRDVDDPVGTLQCTGISFEAYLRNIST